ncbi:MAG: hypothetical protein ACTSQ8_11900 [Candidatus Helarchaeota archaeon]
MSLCRSIKPVLPILEVNCYVQVPRTARNILLDSLECAGKMKWQGNIRRYVCQRCGLALTRNELDNLREQQRDRIREEKGRDFEEKRKRKEYLDWWLSKEK